MLEIEVFFEGIEDEYFNGKNNSLKTLMDGLRLRCIPDDNLLKEISDVLSKPDNHFPFEFYKFEYETFSGSHFLGSKRPLRHVTIDTSISNNEYAQREYTRSMYDSLIEGHEKATHSFQYRSVKDKFTHEILKSLNERTDYKFGLKSNAKSNFDSDLTVLDGGIPIEHKGKGQKCFVKANFALSKKKNGHNVVLIEEPENHLSHIKMKQLIQEIGSTNSRQLIITTHNPLICSRLDLRNVQILSENSNKTMDLKQVPENVAEYFIKSPNGNLLEFVLSSKCILVEGDSEFILIEAFFEKFKLKKAHECGVNIVSVNGTGFKNYMHIAKVTGAKVAVIRDNDKNIQEICIDRYSELVSDKIKVFYDKSNSRATFEICLYEDNKTICDELFGPSRKTLSVQEYMLSSKTEAAYELLLNSRS